ncbi:MAG: MFS transporter [Actinomycetales bacterium]|nr:MFS transporter [Actinomycetales bacterium]
MPITLRSTTPETRLAGLVITFTGLCCFLPILPLAALVFDDAGLGVSQISSLFVLASLSVLVLEIPSGAWADTWSRRALLVLAALLAAAGFALWACLPSYPSFAAGFVLLGAHGALRSGSLEALVYEELDRSGSADRYAALMGRAAAVGTVTTGLAIAVAAPVLAWGGFRAVGAISVVACLLAALVAARLPENRAVGESRGAGDRTSDRVSARFRAYVAVLRDGAAQVRGNGRLRLVLLLVPAVGILWHILDEYVPLLAAAGGVARHRIPLVLLLLYVGVTVGGLLGGVASRSAARSQALVLAGAATVLAGGAVLAGEAGVPAGFLGVALAFAGFQAVSIAVDARLQDAVEGAARATVTSLAGFGRELVALGSYALYAAGSAVLSHGRLFAALALLYLPVAALLAVAGRDRAVASAGDDAPLPPRNAQKVASRH